MIQVWITKEEAANLPALAAKMDAFAKANPAIKLCIQASSEDRKADLSALKTEEVPVAYLPYGQERVAKMYKINPDTRNTILLYKNKKVQANSVNVELAGLDSIFEAALKLREKN